ncbi:hypothetical protein E4U22_004117 [Claviceps purpurea]|uniref:Uncharacterized protein n=1 Tax=Claviceps purpurea (strain 20.1) TaxID=1111077 RepID=M1W8M1_CLAP2|nr:hypothetical protein E4U50_001712 [Claviceps purpurea]KAG6319799.1 hypothetical protein E4U22_004117 [Claviceps purpurea]CCE29363.1 uncharacterized protein CPUR_03056 [Claviceps purpurea 20.1]
MHALSLLALLLPLAVADTHDQCDCMSWGGAQGNSWGHNAVLTQWVCQSFYPNKGQWDASSKRCVGINGNKFDGDTWEGYCKAAGKWGYHKIKANGLGEATGPTLKVGAATGNC